MSEFAHVDWVANPICKNFYTYGFELFKKNQ